jgi:hypothetical protein
MPRAWTLINHLTTDARIISIRGPEVGEEEPHVIELEPMLDLLEILAEETDLPVGTTVEQVERRSAALLEAFAILKEHGRLK